MRVSAQENKFFEQLQRFVLTITKDRQRLTNPTRDLLKSLDHLRGTINTAEGPYQEMYKKTWATLQEMVKEWPRGKQQGGILAFPIHISEEFMARLKDGDWTASIIFLHYGVGMHLLSNKWYVGIWGRRLVATVLPPDEEIPAEWEETVAWARQAVAYTVPYDGEKRKEKSEMGLR